MTLEEIDSLMSEVHQLGVKVVGVTRGSEAAIFSDGEERYQQKPVETRIVDTMGAGDSFISGFLTSYHAQQNMKEALLQAARSAAVTCGEYGAFGYVTKR